MPNKFPLTLSSFEASLRSTQHSLSKACFEADAFEGHELCTVTGNQGARKQTMKHYPKQNVVRPVLSMVPKNLRITTKPVDDVSEARKLPASHVSTSAPCGLPSSHTCSNMITGLPENVDASEEDAENRPPSLNFLIDPINFSDDYMPMTPKVESSCVELIMERSVSMK